MENLQKSGKVIRILVVKPSSLGDILHTFPAVEVLRKHYPNARLDWLVHPAFVDVLKYSPFPVHRVIEFNRREMGRLRRFPVEFLKLITTIRQRNYDLTIDFQGLVRSSIFGFLARGSSQVGFARPRERSAALLYGKKLNVEMELHAVERNVELVNKMLKTNYPVPELRLPTGIFPVELPEEAKGRKIVGLIPGARWPSKSFPAKLFAEAIQKISAKRANLYFIIIGGPDDKKVADEIMQLAEIENISSMVGKTSIGQMIEILSYCGMIISNDSGPIHVAAAQGVPVLGLFGPTNPELTGPYGTIHRIHQADLECVKCMKRNCPNGDYPKCHELDMEEIVKSALDILR